MCPSRARANRRVSSTTDFPDTGCAIAVEFKKIFMDEWSGEPDWAAIEQLRGLLAATVPVLAEALRAMG